MKKHPWLPPTAGYRYIYDAIPIRVIDGDTVIFEVHHEHDMGFHIITRHTHTLETRLVGLNCPETRGVADDVRAKGLAAKAFTMAWLDDFTREPLNGFVKIVTFKDEGDRYGRYLSEVWDTSWSKCLNADLLSSGNAVDYWP